MRDYLANIISVEKQTYTVIGILCVKSEFQPPISVQNHHIVILFDCHFAFGIPVLESKNFSWLHPVKKNPFFNGWLFAPRCLEKANESTFDPP